jgi:hypothetical protein
MLKHKQCAAIVVCLFVLAVTAVAQQVTGSLAAIVQDKSGAVVPNAKVTMTNENSGDVRRATTNTEGYFSITGVFPGSYSVLVEAPGFSNYKVEKLTFNPGDVRTLPNIMLEVGAVGTEVRVTDALEQLTPVDSGEKAVVITTQQLQNVAVVSRSAAEFIKIIPGMTPVGGIENRPGWNGENMGINGNGDGGKQSAIGNFSANGTPTMALDITADGAHTADPGCNCATPVNPNPDMISEFKVQTSNFAAENYKGPVVISTITKSGGRDFHGGAYLYARHHSMYSNEWQNNKLGIARPENKYYFPGGNIGGPVLIPGTSFNKNRDKLFFFAGFEYFKQTIDSGVLRAIVPTEQMRAGDFSNTAYLGAIGSRFGAAGADIATKYPNRRVPVEPGMASLLNLVPQPNLDPAGAGEGYNWAQVLTLDQNMNQFATKVDYNISDYTKLFVRYNRQRELQPFPVQLWWRNAGAVPLPTPVEGRNESDSLSANFTKVLNPTMTNEFIFGYTFVDFPNSYQDYSKMTKATVGYPYQGLFKQDDKIPGFLSWSVPTAGMWLPGGFDPVLFATKHLITANNTLSKVVDTHTLKFGAYFGRIINKQPGNEPSAGLMTFSNGHSLTSGNVLADMVAGLVESYTENTLQIVRDMGWNEAAFFAQDNWKATRRLTLEYGLRVQHMQPWTARNGIGIAAWVPELYSPTAPASEFPGLSWNAKNPDVPLSGWKSRALWWAPRFGFAYNLAGEGNTVIRGGFGRFVYHDPQLAAGAMDLPAGVRRVNLSGGMTLASIDRIQNTGDLVFGGETVDSADNKQPLTDSYSLTISQRLPGRNLFEISYVGNRTRNLINGGALANVNNVLPGAMFGDPTGDANRYRPMPQWQELRVLRHDLYSNYNSLQASLAKQTGRINYTLAYTWGKAMGIINNDLNPFDRDAAYGPLGSDRTHVLSATYVIDLPGLPGDANAFARGVVNGWVLSGIVQAYSGVNIQPNTTNANFNLNAPSPQAGNQLNGAWIFGTNAIRAMPRLTCDPRSNLGENQFVNGACFAPPVAGLNGQPGENGAYVMPYMRGPAYFNGDLSLFKEFSITESKRIQFRAQAYNFMNHPVRSFLGGDPNLSLNFNAQGGNTNPRFGFADNKVGRRTIMLGIKFFF